MEINLAALKELEKRVYAYGNAARANFCDRLESDVSELIAACERIPGLEADNANLRRVNAELRLGYEAEIHRLQDRVTEREEAANERGNEIARLKARLESADAEIESREKRRLEILELLQNEIGTAWGCTECNYSTYHCYSNECAECGEEFPLLNLLAFKLHAAAYDRSEK